MNYRTKKSYNVTIPSQYGTLIVNPNDESFSRIMLDHGFDYGYHVLDNEPMSYLLRYCKENPVVLDVGANIGVYAMILSEKVGEKGKVLAFEPNRMVWQMMVGNLALNSIENVWAYCLGIGAGNYKVRVPKIDYSSSAKLGEVRFDEKNLHEAGQSNGFSEETIDIVTIDSLKLGRVDFIKIDVEGMEIDALEGAQLTIEEHRPVMLVEWLKCDQHELFQKLDDMGYNVWVKTINFLCVPKEIDFKESGEFERWGYLG